MVFLFRSYAAGYKTKIAFSTKILPRWGIAFPNYLLAIQKELYSISLIYY